MKNILKSQNLPRLLAIITALCSILYTAFEAHAQSGLEIAPFIRAKGSYNVINTGLTASKFIINNAPDIGVLFQYPVNSLQTEYIGLELGYVTYSANNFAINPFGGQALTNFRLNAHAHYLSIAGTLRISNLVLFSMGYCIPLSGTYKSTVDLFGSGKTINDDEERSFTSDNMRKTIDLRLGVVLFRLPVAQQRLEFSIIGGYTLATISQSVAVFDTSVPVGQIGADPLAGLRNLGIQPITLSLGVSYVWGL